MIELRPFRAIHYNASRDPDLSSLVAPPYDVLDQSDKDALLAKSSRNIVAVDLPFIPPKSAGPPEVYTKAAALLKSWLDDGTLMRDAQPALYVYHQSFKHEGRSYTRRMFFALLRLTPFSEGDILPHEETFGGPKEDRLALMKATACNLSPIFGLYSDPKGQVDALFSQHVARNPDILATLDDVENRLWIVPDAGIAKSAASLMAARKVFIADGHHRYGTALLYRDWLTGRQGSLAPDHPANFVLFVLASMDDPGCLILPYNRVLSSTRIDDVLRAWQGLVEPAAEGAADLVLYEGASQRTTGVRFTQRQKLDQLAPEKSAAWRQLDVAYLHKALIEGALHASPAGKTTKVGYVKSADAARSASRDDKGVALLLRATPMAQLRAVSEAGDLMPQKSTFFFPKLITGLTINVLE